VAGTSKTTANWSLQYYFLTHAVCHNGFRGLVVSMVGVLDAGAAVAHSSAFVGSAADTGFLSMLGQNTALSGDVPYQMCKVRFSTFWTVWPRLSRVREVPTAVFLAAYWHRHDFAVFHAR